MRSGWQRDKTYNLSTNASDTDTRDAERYARRVACNDDAELRAILANGATRPISAAHALRSLQVLAFACQEQLDRYPSSLASDDSRIASGELKPFSNERNALVVVRGEKRICRMYVCHVAGRACAGAFRRLRVFLECCAPGLCLFSLCSLFSFLCSLLSLTHTCLPHTHATTSRYVDLATRAAGYLALEPEERTRRVREECDNPDDNICNAITRLDRELLKAGQ